MDTSAFNILERAITDHLFDGSPPPVPRILVTRHALIPSQFGPWFDGVPDQQGYALSRLMSSVEQRDWTPYFRLAPLANNPERSVIELDHAHYSDAARNARSQIVFSFSVPVSTDHGFLFYGKSDRGFLWARGFLCRFQGSFEKPAAIEYLNVWMS